MVSSEFGVLHAEAHTHKWHYSHGNHSVSFRPVQELARPCPAVVHHAIVANPLLLLEVEHICNEMFASTGARLYRPTATSRQNTATPSKTDRYLVVAVKQP